MTTRVIVSRSKVDWFLKVLEAEAKRQNDKQAVIDVKKLRKK